MSQLDKYAKYCRVLENNDSFLAIHKEPGVSFHAVGKQQGILQIIREMEEQGAIAEGPRLYPVHRLDQVTSGVLLFARGRDNANKISNEFRHNRVRKFYIALSDRKPTKKQGRISGDMERGRRSGWILTRTHKNPAITFFKSKSVTGRRPGLRLYLLKPRTGKTHQLRVAMKSLSAPILGDPLYGRYDLAREEDRTHLHAYYLKFTLNGETHIIRSQPSPGFEFESAQFQKALKEYENPEELDWPG